MFCGEHFHFSELNRTDQTRVMISFRLTRSYSARQRSTDVGVACRGAQDRRVAGI